MPDTTPLSRMSVTPFLTFMCLRCGEARPQGTCLELTTLAGRVSPCRARLGFEVAGPDTLDSFSRGRGHLAGHRGPEC